MFEVGVVRQFEAAHQLTGDFGPATRLHGHTYTVEVEVRGNRLKDDGTLCDVGALSDAVDETIAPLNYRNLDDVAGLNTVNTTAEMVANYLFKEVSKRVRWPGVEALRVRVWESPRVYAAYEAQIEAAE